MKKFLSVLLLATALVTSNVSARGWSHGYRGGYHGGFHRGGLVTGLVVGGLIGATIAPRYYNSYQYQQPVVYTQRVPVYCVDAAGYQYICQWRYVQPEVVYGP